MEGLLTNYYENHFLYISGIHHIESKTIQGVALDEALFPSRHRYGPGHGRNGAVGQSRARLHAAVGTVPPFVMRFDAGSVPVGYLVLSEHDQEASAEDAGRRAYSGCGRCSPLAGRVGPAAFRRQPAHDRRPVPIRIGCAPTTCVPTKWSPPSAAGNAISPSGNVRVKAIRCRSCRSTSMVADVRRTWRTSRSARRQPVRSYIRDLGKDRGRHRTSTGYALVNGRRAVYISVTKRADASTLAWSIAVKANLPKMQAVLPGRHRRQLRVRPVALCRTRDAGRRRGRRARRRSHRADGAAVPARLAQRRSSSS